MDIDLLNKSIEIGKTIFLVTKLEEKEQYIRNMTKSYVDMHPEQFNCDEKCLYVSLNYASLQNSDRFYEIKRIQEAVNQAARLKGEFKGILALDFTEYLKKEEEYFFHIILKFLHDMKKNYCWQYIFTVTLNKSVTDKDIKAMQNVIAHYLRPKAFIEERVDEGSELLKDKKRMPFLNCYSEEALRELAKIINSNKELADMTILESLTEDILAVLAIDIINGENLQSYLGLEDNLIELLSPVKNKRGF